MQPEKNEETRIQKNDEKLRKLWGNFKCSNIWIIGVPEEKRARNQKLIWKNNEGELPQSGEGNRLPGSSESPKETGPKEEHTKAHHNDITQD